MSGIKTNRNLDELALVFEHFVKDNGNDSAHADIFRNCRTDDSSFENGIRIGVVYGYIHFALKCLINSGRLSDNQLNNAKEALKILLEDRSYQRIVDTLNYLVDKNLAN